MIERWNNILVRIGGLDNIVKYCYIMDVANILKELNMANPFTRQAVLRYKILRNVLEIERLNCMPITPEYYYPGSKFYTYDDVVQGGALEKDLYNYGFSEKELHTVYDKLFNAPAGTSCKFPISSKVELRQ